MLALNFLLLILPTTHAADIPAALDRQEFCRVLLDPNREHDIHLAERLTSAQTLTFENLQSVVKRLVDEGTITPAQAADYFAESLLGEFSPIFSRYVLAELKSRNYAPADIPDFIMHFDHMFTPARQVDFAIAVARRMLLTVNDDPGHDSPEGLKSFKAAVQASGVEAPTYARFLQTWRFVRRSQPETVLHFLLINIKNLGAIHQAQNAPPTPAPSKPKSDKLKVFFAFWPRQNESYQLTSPRVVNADYIQDDMPSLVSQLPAPASFRARHFESATGLGDYLARFDGVPPFAHDYLLNRDLPSLNRIQLTELTASKRFLSFSSNVQESARAELAEFRRFGLLVDQILELNAQAKYQFAQRTHRPPVSHPERVAVFLNRFFTTLGDLQTEMESDKRAIVINRSFNETYRDFRHDPQFALSSEDFMAIANATINQIFSMRFFYPARSLADALMAMSQDFELRNEQANMITRSLRTHVTNRFRDKIVTREIPVGSDPDFAWILSDQQWGKRAAPVVFDAVSESAQLAQKLGELRAFLQEHGESAEAPRELLVQLLKEAS